jgi:Flp pilus assembly protein TadG
LRELRTVPPAQEDSMASSQTALRRLLARFGAARDGSTAVEFGLVALPFFGMLFAILQTALVFFADQVFQTAVADSARLIMTGQAQSASLTQDGFKDEICSRLVAVFDCQDGVSVDVETADTFADATPGPVPIKNGKIDTSGFGFSDGDGCQIVTVRAIYVWPLWFNLINLGLANYGSDGHLMVATAVFRNEPFGSATSCGS